MSRLSFAVVVSLIIAGFPGAKTRAETQPDLATLETASALEALPKLSQHLMNALPGDSTVWKRLLSERALYADEDGDVTDKRTLLSGFGPFPPGLKGSITVTNPRVGDFGDVAVIVFDAMEEQTVYDQHIDVHYLSTFIWRREDGRWRVIGAHTGVVGRDPVALPIDAKRLDEYVGTYTLSGKRRYRVERRGDTLAGGAEGSELAPLIAVGENVFADSGRGGRITRVFVIEPDGSVKRMVQRRKFADIVWERVE